MILDEIFAASSPLRFIGAFVIGVPFGYWFVASLPIHAPAAVRSWAFFGLVVAWGTFDTTRRYLEGIPTWAASIGTAIALGTFVVGLYFGLRLRGER